MNTTLAPGILEEIIRHAKECSPKEACGLLAGAGSATRAMRTRNVAGAETEYEMDPQELIERLRDIRSSGEELIAIYHSHPRGPAWPSKSDIERAYYPAAAYLIVSLADPERPLVKGFRFVDREVIEIEVHVIV